MKNPSFSGPLHGIQLNNVNSKKTGAYEEVGLGLIHYSRGYFQSTPVNRFNGEDLDVPTFQRRNVTIKK